MSRALRGNLRFEGFDVLSVGRGSAALKAASEWSPDLVLLDVALPDGNGFALFGRLYQRRDAIISLSARGHKTHKPRRVKRGADEYGPKPFDLEDLVARVYTGFRRAASDMNQLVLGNVVINFDLRQAMRAGRAVHLTHREFELLRYLTERRGRVVSRDELLREVWGYAETPITRSVDHAVARLRRKIEPDPHQPKFVHTVHGDGYCLMLDERSDAAPAS